MLEYTRRYGKKADYVPTSECHPRDRENWNCGGLVVSQKRMTIHGDKGDAPMDSRKIKGT